MNDASYTQVTGKLDLISRQDAIEWCLEGLNNLPSVEPEERTKERTETHACDCISRQAAIDVAKQHWYKPDIAKALEDLPSAEPEKVLVAEVKLSKEQIQDAVDKAVEKMKAELEPCDFCKHKDDCGDMALYCPSERRTDEQHISE